MSKSVIIPVIYAMSFEYRMSSAPGGGGGDPILEYFDQDGNNVTPVPLHEPDEEEQAEVRLALFSQ